MAINTTRQTEFSLLDFTVNRPVRSSDWKRLVRQTNYLYSRSGVTLAGIVFDPPFTTTNTSYTQNNASSGRDLSTFRPTFTMPRRTQSSGTDKARLIAQFYSYRMDYRATIYRDETTSITSLTGNGLNIYRWNSVTFDINWADVHVGGSTANPSATLQFSFEVRLDTSFGGTAQLFALTLSLANAPASAIPTTE